MDLQHHAGRKQLVPPDYLTLKPNDAEAHFVSKDVAILQRPSALINVLTSKPDEWQFGKNWDIANFPNGDGHHTGSERPGLIAARAQQAQGKKATHRPYAH